MFESENVTIGHLCDIDIRFRWKQLEGEKNRSWVLIYLSLLLFLNSFIMVV